LANFPLVGFAPGALAFRFFRPSASLSSFLLFSDVTTFSTTFNGLAVISTVNFGRCKACLNALLEQAHGMRLYVFNSIVCCSSFLMSLPSPIIAVLAHFQPLFTAPTWKKVVTLLIGTPVL